MLSPKKYLSIGIIFFLLSTATTWAKPFKVGVFSGKEVDVAEEAARVAKEKFNLDVEIIEFNDGVIPNEALNSGSLDVNAFQHKPYLDEQIEAHGYELEIVGNTFVYPIAAYSNNIKHKSELVPGSTITLPNDASNLGRSLLLLEREGLITLEADAGLNPTLLDVKDNPNNYNLVELEAPLLVRSLDDETVGLSVINTNLASAYGLTPSKDGLFVEDKESIYVNLIVARKDNYLSPEVKQFVEAYQSEEVYQKAYQLFDGGVIKGW